jgi:hypothetical protein
MHALAKTNGVVSVEDPGSVLKLPSLGVEIPLERLYERTVAARTPRPVA